MLTYFRPSQLGALSPESSHMEAALFQAETTLILEPTVSVVLNPDEPLVATTVAVNAAPEHGSWQTRCKKFCESNALLVQHVLLPSKRSKRDLRVVILHGSTPIAAVVGTYCYAGTQEGINGNVERVYEYALHAAKRAIEDGLCPAPTLRQVESLVSVPWTSLAKRGLYVSVSLAAIDNTDDRSQAVHKAIGHAEIAALGVDGEGQGWCTCGWCAHPARTSCPAGPTHVQVGVFFVGGGTPVVICDYVDSMTSWASLLRASMTERTVVGVWGGGGADDALALRLTGKAAVDLQAKTAFCTHLRGRLSPRVKASRQLSLKSALHALHPPADEPDAPYDKHQHLHQHELHFGAWQRATRQKMTQEHKDYAEVDGYAVGRLTVDYIEFMRLHRDASQRAADPVEFVPATHEHSIQPGPPSSSPAARSPARKIARREVPDWDGNANTLDEFTAAICAYSTSETDAGHDVGDRDLAWVPGGPLDYHRRWYVLPSGAVAGIYYGTWDGHEYIRKFAEGEPSRASSGANTPTSSSVSTLCAAIDICLHNGVAPIFRGPRPDIVPASDGTLALGMDLSTCRAWTLHLGMETHVVHEHLPGAMECSQAVPEPEPAWPYALRGLAHIFDDEERAWIRTLPEDDELYARVDVYLREREHERERSGAPLWYL